MPTASYVSTGKPKIGGSVNVGPLTATLPTATGTALTGFTDLGYCSDDGIENDGSIDTSEIVAWGGDVVQEFETQKADKFTMTLIEALNVDVLKEIFGSANVSGTLSTGVTVSVNNTPHTARKWVIDMVMTNNVAKRVCLPNAKITTVDTITYKDDEAVGYAITITAFPDADGYTHYEYIKGA